MAFAVVFALVSVFLWGICDLVTKYSLDHDSKWRVIFLGQIFGGLIVLCAAVFFGEAGKWLEFLPWIIALGAINLVGMLTFYSAMKAKGVALTSSVVNAYPFITLGLGLFFFGEKVAIHQILASALILTGVLAITFKKGQKIRFDKSFLFALASMAVWGVLFFLLKIPVSIAGALLITAGLKIATPIASLPVFFIKKISLFEKKTRLMLLIALVGLLDSLALLGYNLAIKDAPVALIAPIAGAVPAVSVILAVLILKEKISIRQTLGVLAIITGIAILTV